MTSATDGKESATTAAETKKASPEPSSALTPDVIITLDIGGTVFRTTTATLQSKNAAHNYFAGLLFAQPETTAFFVDRSPKVFDHILYYLRHNTLDLRGISARDTKQLLEDAEFYRLPQLTQLIYPPLSKEEHAYGICLMYSGCTSWVSKTKLRQLFTPQKLFEWVSAFADSLEGRRITAQLISTKPVKQGWQSSQDLICTIAGDVFRTCMLSGNIASRSSEEENKEGGCAGCCAYPPMDGMPYSGVPPYPPFAFSPDYRGPELRGPTRSKPREPKVVLPSYMSEMGFSEDDIDDYEAEAFANMKGTPDPAKPKTSASPRASQQGVKGKKSEPKKGRAFSRKGP